MPVLGLGLHVLIALFFAVHAVRSGQNNYWLFILFSFPLLGSAVYFFAVYLPGSRLEHQARRAMVNAARAVDPERDLREARAGHEAAPSAQSELRLAAALLDLGRFDEAAAHYEQCLRGPFSDDPDIRFGAARAFLEGGRRAEARAHLTRLSETAPDFRPEQVALLSARLHAENGDAREARQCYEDAIARHGSFEAKVEYAIFALVIGDRPTAARLNDEIDRTVARWTRPTRDLNAPLLQRLRAARQAAPSA